jgi:hypothetical protein
VRPVKAVWAHPFAPAPVLVAAGATAAVVSVVGADLPVLVAWAVLALSAGYAISGSV